MKISKRWFAGMVVVFLTCSIRANATTVSLNGLTIVSDNYEGDTVGNPPVADVGSWVGTTFIGRDPGAVTNAAIPGPASGTQYLVLGGASPGNGLFAEFTWGVNDVIEFSSMVFVPASAAAVSFPWQMSLVSVSNTSSRPINFWRNSSGTWENAGNLFTPPSAFQHGVWQEWELQYTAGQSTASLLIDGTSATIPVTTTGLAGSTYRIGPFSNGTNQLFLDAPVVLAPVPEPATGSLLSLGVFGLMRARRGRRA